MTQDQVLLATLLAALSVAGFTAAIVDDGDGFEKLKDASATSVVEAATGCGCATIGFRREGEENARHRVFIVEGNGRDLVSDWTTSDNAFDAAITAWLDTVAS